MSISRHVPAALGGLAQREHLGVGGRVLAQLALVVRGRQHLAPADEHRADRHVVVFQRPHSLAQGQLHEIVVAWEEALAHRSLTQWLAAGPARPSLPKPTWRPPPNDDSRAPRPREAQPRALHCGRRSRHRRARLRHDHERRGVGYGPLRAERRGRALSPRPSRRSALGARAASADAAADGRTQVLHLAPGASVTSALRRLRAQRDVAWAEPDYTAHAAGGYIPDDEGIGHEPGDWQQLQWNFVGEFGVNAPQAWSNVAADGAPGGKGVVVAVLDTGVAYANRGPFRRSPDFTPYEFVRGMTSSPTTPTPTTATATARSWPA